MGTASSKQSLTPEEFDELLKSTEFTSAEIDKWYENFKAEFPKGHITRRQFQDVYHKLFPAGDASRFSEHIFRVYDVDGNGLITFAEFLANLHVSAYGSPEEKLRATFRLYDIDRNGFITDKEIVSILMAIYRSRSTTNYRKRANDDADLLMSKLDVNKDNKISVDEFIKASSSCSLVQEILKGSSQ